MNRMKELRELRGINMREAARQLSMPYTTYVNYEKGVREPNSETLIEIAKFYETTIDYLLCKSDVNTRSISTFPSVLVPIGFAENPPTSRVPRVGRIACGDPITAEENIEAYDDVPKQWRSDFTLVCCGDSMVPKIQDGDVVAIRKQEEVSNGEIAAVRIGDEATLKYVYRHADYIELRPANPAYQSIIRSKDDMNDVRIEGKAVGLFRELD